MNNLRQDTLSLNPDKKLEDDGGYANSVKAESMPIPTKTINMRKVYHYPTISNNQLDSLTLSKLQETMSIDPQNQQNNIANNSHPYCIEFKSGTKYSSSVPIVAHSKDGCETFIANRKLDVSENMSKLKQSRSFTNSDINSSLEGLNLTQKQDKEDKQEEKHMPGSVLRAPVDLKNIKTLSESKDFTTTCFLPREPLNASTDTFKIASGIVATKRNNNPKIPLRGDHGKSSKLVLLAGPCTLIYVNVENGKEVFRIDDVAINIIESYGSEKITVISLGGKCGVGKTFLLSQIIEERQINRNQLQSQRNSNSTKSTTQGIVMSIVRDDDYNLYMFLDLEGVGDDHMSIEHDKKLLSIALLLSSCYLHNTNGIFTVEEFCQLGMLCEMTYDIFKQSESRGQRLKHMKTRTSTAISPSDWHSFKSEQNVEESINPPLLIWIMRDFNMALYDENNTPISTCDYFETAINPMTELFNPFYDENKQKSEKLRNDYYKYDTSDKQRVYRELVHDYFSNRECSSLASPTDLDRLESVQFLVREDLSNLFLRQISVLRNKLIQNSRDPSMEMKRVTGPSFIRHLQLFTDSISKNTIPSLSMWISYQKDENNRNQSLFEDEFLHELRETFQDKVPMDPRILQKQAKEIRQDTIHKFKDRILGGVEQSKWHKNLLKKRCQKLIKLALKENEDFLIKYFKKDIDEYMETNHVYEKLIKKNSSDCDEVYADINSLFKLYLSNVDAEFRVFAKNALNSKKVFVFKTIFTNILNTQVESKNEILESLRIANEDLDESTQLLNNYKNKIEEKKLEFLELNEKYKAIEEQNSYLNQVLNFTTEKKAVKSCLPKKNPVIQPFTPRIVHNRMSAHQ